MLLRGRTRGLTALSLVVNRALGHSTFHLLQLLDNRVLLVFGGRALLDHRLGRGLWLTA